MFRNHVPERCPIFSHGIGLVPEQISLKNSISQCSTVESVRSSYRNCNLNCTESVKPLQNPRCFPCDLHDFAFGTMVPGHSESFSFEKQGLFRNIFRFSTKTLGVPGHLLEFSAGVPAGKLGGFAACWLSAVLRVVETRWRSVPVTHAPGVIGNGRAAGPP